MLITSYCSKERVSALQRKLYQKAKQQPGFRFHSLYDKVCRNDVLQRAYDLVKQNKGSPGLDGITFKVIEQGCGKQIYLQELQEKLKGNAYQASPIKRVDIPKGNGETRPLGIPCIEDRIVQMAVKLIIEPIFEAGFSDSSYGFRPKRSAHQAMDAITDALQKGHTQVIDADLSKYFDTIVHKNLMKTVAVVKGSSLLLTYMLSNAIFSSMTRPLRVQYPGAWYHIMNRGRRREDIFSTSEDYIAFIEILKETVSLWNINIVSYCLMPNHYHLLLHTPEGNLSRGMRHINGVYTQRYNRKNRHDGQLFRGRYKSILLDSDNYLTVLVRYIHRNPIRAGMVDRLEDYSWSSHNGYLSKSSKWNWLNKDAFFVLLTDVKSKYLKEYRAFVREEDSDDIVGVFSKKKIPSILGTEKFKDWVTKKYSTHLLQEEIPERKALVPSKKKIKDSVCKVYNVDIKSLYGIHRGVTNDARNAAIYLTRLLRRDTLKEIGKEFRIYNYSSVSSIIEKIKTDIIRNKKSKKQIEKAREDVC